MFKTRTAVFYQVWNTCCECFEQLQKRPVIGCFRFLIQLLIRMTILYKILCSLVFNKFYQYKVTVMVTDLNYMHVILIFVHF